MSTAPLSGSEHAAVAPATGDAEASVQVLLAGLPAACRAAAILMFRDHKNCGEIAGLLGVSRKQAKRYVTRALVHCRRQFESAATGAGS